MMPQDLFTLHRVKQDQVESLYELQAGLGQHGMVTIPLRINIASDNALIIYVDLDELLVANEVIKLLTKSILKNRPSYIQEYIPSYKSLFLEFNSIETDIYEVRAFIKRCLIEPSLLQVLSAYLTTLKQGKIEQNEYRVHRIPVCYELTSLPNDLAKVANEKSLTKQQVITHHCASQLQVFATGFLPGFVYLGEIDDSIQVSRLERPRAKVPAGAVAIADKQTAIYPIESPGGWHILGYTPINLISENLHNEPIMKVGDRIQFYEISANEYRTTLSKQVSE